MPLCRPKTPIDLQCHRFQYPYYDDAAVFLDGTAHVSLSNERKVCYLETYDGAKRLKVVDGDWIVIQSNGTVTTYNDNTFKSLYDLLD